jgi:hypothetical protein
VKLEPLGNPGHSQQTVSSVPVDRGLDLEALDECLGELRHAGHGVFERLLLGIFTVQG